MKLKLLFLSVLIVSVAILAEDGPSNPAPIVNIVFGNSTDSVESVFSFAGLGPYLDNKVAALYNPQFLGTKNGQLKMNSIVFDPQAYKRGVGTYPFLFTYKGGFYYLFFSSSKLLGESTELPFFATVIKITGLDDKTKSAKVETITNIEFAQNDHLAIALDKDEIKFYNITKKRRVTTLPKEKRGLPLIPVPTRKTPDSSVRTLPQAPLSGKPRNIPVAPPKPPRRLPVNPANSTPPPVPPRA
jgi:hypothetical protein